MTRFQMMVTIFWLNVRACDIYIPPKSHTLIDVGVQLRLGRVLLGPTLNNPSYESERVDEHGAFAPPWATDGIPWPKLFSGDRDLVRQVSAVFVEEAMEKIRRAQSEAEFGMRGTNKKANAVPSRVTRVVFCSGSTSIGTAELMTARVARRR